MSDGVLLKQAKDLKLAVTLMLSATVLMFASGMYTTIAEPRFSPIGTAAIVFAMIVLGSSRNLKAVRAEIAARKL